MQIGMEIRDSRTARSGNFENFQSSFELIRDFSLFSGTCPVSGQLVLDQSVLVRGFLEHRAPEPAPRTARDQRLPGRDC